MRGRAAWVVLGLLLAAGGLWWLHGGHGPGRNNASSSASGISTTGASAHAQAASTFTGHPGTIATTASNSATILVPGQELHYRLSNTTKHDGDLLRNDRAILLANAVIDTTRPLDGLKIPDNLRAPPDNGSWIVQANGPLNASFRALLAGAGAQVISYIPNNAELVLAPADVAQQLAASPLVASVLPYEPYYKLTDPALLKVAVTGADLPPDVALRLGVFAGAQDATLAALKKLGADVVGSEPSPFGTTYDVHLANGTFIDAANIPGVMVMEAIHRRMSANDLSRMRLGVSTNTVTNVDYLDLTGLGVFVNVNDSDVDINHPDFRTGRIALDPLTAFGTDANGHGTHVIGTILGNGSESGTVGTNAQGSVTNASFRGMATNASAFVIVIGVDSRPQGVGGAPPSDAYLQETAGRTNVFISNNSWDYDGDASYDMAAASYDASVRDAVPEVTGPQPLLFVFSSGNSGGGGSDGSGGIPDTILSPATAKNVITVGALEQLRKITNTYVADGATNPAWFAETDNSNQVASFSSRGNVGVGIEGPAGRFKPDVVAPGTFVLSDKSEQWDQGEYYNPTNFSFNTEFNQTVTNGALAAYSIVIPANAVSFTVTVLTNDFSPSPFPQLPVFVDFTDNPTTNVFDAMGTNTVTVALPTLPVGSRIFYSVGNATNGFVSFDVQTLVETTNDNGNLLTVLSNLNQSLGQWYRYESGTSMSAAGVSGTLALMQEFLEQRLGLTTHSPALMKALLINGARTVGSQYDFNVTGAVTSQGWGLPDLSNSIPGVLTNGGANVAMQFFDQTTNMLATGQSKTRMLALGNGLGAQPLRVTLVWTDPPGNPAAGVKLVNDLDLIVSNLDNNTVFYGNDIPSGSAYNVTRSVTNGPGTNLDSVNNVENVYLFPPLSTNYSITVSGHRVNVNAVDSNTTNVVQDYALVVSYGDGGVFSNAFSMVDMPIVSSNNASGLLTVTNGLPLLNQRVGGNSQFAYVPFTSTNGIGNQWQFYVYTNPGTNAQITNVSAAFTNVAFVTFDPANLGVPRMGTREEANPANGVRTEADIDLYVSQDPTLTNLNPVAINAAFKSLTRTGTEKVLLTNSAPGQTYYVGVKSEDQQGAQYALVGVALTNSFGQLDSNGNVTLTILAPALPTSIPTGSPAHPGSVTVLALTTVDLQARKVVVEDTIQHQEFGDLVGAVSHAEKSVVLNNHSFFSNPADQTETLLYDDSGEVDDQFLLGPPFTAPTPPAPRHSDGPGTLSSFTGDNISDGIWTLSMVNDSSPSDTGFINNLSIFVEPQQPTNGFLATIPGDSWFYDFIDVPADATNLTITTGISTSGPVDVYLRRGAFPDANDFDKFALFPAPGGTMTLGLFDSPPLNPGRYFIGVFNPTPVPQTVNVHWTFGLSLAAPQPLEVLSIGNEPILDDAVMYSTNHVGQNSRVVSAEVGVRIDHPRESDLVLTLVSPSGTRVLLAENRGGLDANGYGSGVNKTNFTSLVSNGSFAGSTNPINVLTNSGTLLINYNMFTVPDDLRVYYQGARIFDSGLISGAGNFAVDFGPGASTTVTVVMNELGTNPNTNDESDAWQYQVTEITKSITYATFTEDSNKTSMPIKFAVPPFGGGAAFTPAVTNIISTFEGASSGIYAAPSSVDGWNVVDTNPVRVVTVPALAANEGNAIAGQNVLALHNGGITRVLPTTAGQSYTLTFVSHGRPVANNPGGWWKGEGNANDSSGIAHPGNFMPAPSYTNGEVGNAFSLNGIDQFVDVPDSPSLDPVNAVTVEAWIDPAAIPQNPGGASIINKTGATSGYSLGYDPANNISVQFTVFAGGAPATSPDTPITPLTWHHVAGVYDGTNVTVYFDGISAGSNAATGLITESTSDLQIGGSASTTYFTGSIDEATVYTNALSVLQIQDIYAAGSAGKWLPPQIGLTVAANISLDGQSQGSFTGADQWTNNIYTFTALSNGTVLTIQSLTNNDGILVDSFQLVQNPAPNTNNYYLPEETLSTLAGESSQGDWKLEVLDNRLGATNPEPMLVSWQLSLDLERVNPATQALSNAVPITNTVLPGFITYYVVYVPPWAQFATNILTVTGGGPASLLFNQNSLPGLTNGDFQLVAPTTTGGSFTLSGGSIPPLVPGTQYYLAVTNSGATPATFSLEVDFGDITPLFNLTPVTSAIAPITTQPHYFFFDVPAATPAVSFLLYNLSGNVDLYASKGLPLPSPSGFNYDSVNPGTNDDIITISSNSAPVALSAGRWYLGVFNNDTNTNAVNYTIEAVILTPTIIPLTNDVPYTMTNISPLLSQETFFSFDITNAPAGALFELYALSGNVDLGLDLNTLPFSPPYSTFGNPNPSANPGTNNEQIVVRTNSGPASLNGVWYLVAPNQTSSNVTYTIHAVVTDTNGLLVSAVPISPVVMLPVGGATGPTLTWNAVPGECYDVYSSPDLINWTLLPIFPMPINAAGPTISVTDPTPIIGMPARFYKIVQVVCP